LIAPLHAEWDCWSIGKAYYEGDVWTCDKKLEKIIAHYDYLALEAADKRFWDDNGFLFKEEDRGIAKGVFKINRIRNGVIFEKLWSDSTA
jgi:hypothetical protein